MQIKIRSKNFDITPAIDDYVMKKLQTLGKFITNESATLCEIEIGRTTTHHKSGDIFRAEVNINIPGQKQVYAVSEESDLYAAIDIVRDEVERLILTQKNKHRTVWRRGASQIKNILKMVDIRNFRRRNDKN
jgi:putative sigma-54 modulation protein